MPVICQISYEFYKITVSNLDIAFYWIFKNTLQNIKYKFKRFLFSKLWMKVITNYEWAHRKSPNTILFESKLSTRLITIKYYRMTILIYQNQKKYYCDYQRILTDRIHQFNKRFNRKELTVVITEIRKSFYSTKI